MRNFSFSLWSLNIWGPPLTLQDCLQAFFQADELTGDNMYSCEKCGKSVRSFAGILEDFFSFSNRLRNGIKNCRVIHLPEVSFVQMKSIEIDLINRSYVFI